MAAESELQKKILNFLDSRGFITVKIIAANKNGFADIIACSPKGRFWSIEVKAPGKKVDPAGLQAAKIERLKQNNAVAFWCNSYDSFKISFEVFNI